jgi:hypothetical protein
MNAAITTRTRRRIATFALALAACVVAPLATSSPASAYWTTSNTAQTPSGGYLQSTGVCGYGQFNFTVRSTNLEYIQFGLAAPNGGVQWSAQFLPVGRRFHTSVPLAGPLNQRFYVRGWDWTNRGWVTATVMTSFWYPSSGMTLDGC